MARGNDKDWNTTAGDFIKALSAVSGGGGAGALGALTFPSFFRKSGEESPFETTPSRHTTAAKTATSKPFSLAGDGKSPVTAPTMEEKKKAMALTFEAVWKAGNARKDLDLLDRPMRSRSRARPVWGDPHWGELLDILHKVGFRRDAYGYGNHGRYQAAMQDLAYNWTPALHIEMAEHLEKVTGVELLPKGGIASAAVDALKRVAIEDKAPATPGSWIDHSSISATDLTSGVITSDKLSLDKISFGGSPLVHSTGVGGLGLTASDWGGTAAKKDDREEAIRFVMEEFGKKVAVPVPPSVVHDPIDQLPDDLLTELANEGSETPRGVW